MRGLRLVAAIMLSLLFVGTTAILVTRFEELRGEQAVFDELSEEVEEVRVYKRSLVDSEVWLKPSAEAQQILPEYAFLYQENADLAGWIKIEDTRINYPVMSTPEKPEFYLHRDFYGQESYSGTPFIGQGYEAENPILMIFGHHMRNGTMFSDLMKYQDCSFWSDHRTIQLDTLYETQEYEIFAAGYAPLASEAEQYMRFYAFMGDISSEYQEYIQLLKEEALYETGIWPERAPLLLLITCSYQETDGRFFVAGCLKKEQTSEWDGGKNIYK